MRIIKLLIIPLAAAFVTGCATTTKSKLQTSAAVPAAEATAKVTEHRDGNNKLTVEAKHLAQPEKVSTGAHAYVVWVQPTRGEARPQNVGVLRIGDDLKGEMTTNVPYDEFNVFVTAEPSSLVTSPSGKKIFALEEVHRVAH